MDQSWKALRCSRMEVIEVGLGLRNRFAWDDRYCESVASVGLHPTLPGFDPLPCSLPPYMWNRCGPLCDAVCRASRLLACSGAGKHGLRAVRTKCDLTASNAASLPDAVLPTRCKLASSSSRLLALLPVWAFPPGIRTTAPLADPVQGPHPHPASDVRALWLVTPARADASKKGPAPRTSATVARRRTALAAARLPP